MATYSGTVKNLMPHGIGAYIYDEDGTILEGQFQDGLAHGFQRTFKGDFHSICQFKNGSKISSQNYFKNKLVM